MFSFSLVHLLLAADHNEGHYQGFVDHSLFLRVGVRKKKSEERTKEKSKSNRRE